MDDSEQSGRVLIHGPGVPDFRCGKDPRGSQPSGPTQVRLGTFQLRLQRHSEGTEYEYRQVLSSFNFTLACAWVERGAPTLVLYLRRIGELRGTGRHRHEWTANGQGTISSSRRHIKYLLAHVPDTHTYFIQSALTLFPRARDAAERVCRRKLIWKKKKVEDEGGRSVPYLTSCSQSQAAT